MTVAPGVAANDSGAACRSGAGAGDGLTLGDFLLVSRPCLRPRLLGLRRATARGTRSTVGVDVSDSVAAAAAAAAAAASIGEKTWRAGRATLLRAGVDAAPPPRGRRERRGVAAAAVARLGVGVTAGHDARRRPPKGWSAPPRANEPGRERARPPRRWRQGMGAPPARSIAPPPHGRLQTTVDGEPTVQDPFENAKNIFDVDLTLKGVPEKS